MEKPLEDYLEKNRILYDIYEHPAVFTVEEHKRFVKNIPGLHTKNLFLKDEKGRFFLVCMPAEKKLDLKSLGKRLGSSKLHFSSPEELKSELGLTPGSVSLFGMIHAKSAKLILDKEIWDTELVGFHPNINTATLVISHGALVRFYNSLKSEKEVLEIG